VEPQKRSAPVVHGASELILPRPLWVVGAFLIYLLTSLLVFGLKIIQNPSLYYVGKGPEAALIMWMLCWWPYAIIHRLNPFFTFLVWAPRGYNLTWATSIPALSLIVSPVTLNWGPVPAFNLLALLGPAANATAAFALCATLTSQFWPALLGGYIFGLSPFVTGHMLMSHLSLVWIPCPPLMAYLVYCCSNSRIWDRISDGVFEPNVKIFWVA